MATSAQCKPAEVKAVLKTRQMLATVVPGETTLQQLTKLAPPVRKKATLARLGQDDLMVAFYPMSLLDCPWIADGPVNLPVIFRSAEGPTVVVGYGLETLKTLQRQGWELGSRSQLTGIFTPTAWPWQNANYAYLPMRY